MSRFVSMRVANAYNSNTIPHWSCAVNENKRNALTVNFKCFSFLKYQSPLECGCVHSFLLIASNFQRFLTESSR